MTRRRFMRIASAAMSGSLPASQMNPSHKPNIVFLYADDMGFGDLGCFGDPEVKTPHLDRMASEGIRLTDFHVTAPVCCPSRSGFLTGRYPLRNGLFTNIRNDIVNYGYRYSMLEYASSPEMTQGLDLREVTIAQALKRAGYTTGVVGKWDGGRNLPYLPLQRGFDFSLDDAPGELYNLEADPGETRNLAREKPDVLQMVRERWVAWMNEMATSEPRGPFSSREYFRVLGFPR